MGRIPMRLHSVPTLYMRFFHYKKVNLIAMFHDERSPLCSARCANHQCGLNLPDILSPEVSDG